MSSKSKTIVSWVLQGLLAALFLLASTGKLAASEAVVQMFRDWGLPDGLFRIIGVLELAGAVGLLVPRLAGYAALGLLGVMVGAAATHLLNGEGLQVLRPLIFMVLLAGVVALRRPWPFASTS